MTGDYEARTAMHRNIATVLRQLYPQNPDVVLGREARIIGDALIADGWTLSPTDGSGAHG